MGLLCPGPAQDPLLENLSPYLKKKLLYDVLSYNPSNYFFLRGNKETKLLFVLNILKWKMGNYG